MIGKDRQDRRAARSPAVVAAVLAAALAAPGGDVSGVGMVLAQDADCRAPSEIADPDVARAAGDLSDPALCLSEVETTSAGVDWRLIVIRNIAEPGPLWAVPHDEEDAAFTTGVYAVLRYGGVMVAIENGERRNVDGLDPNHVFVAVAGETAPCDIAEPPLAFIDAFLSDWDRTHPVVGLHSNWDGHAEGGGRGTISINRSDDKMIPFPSSVATGRYADEDTIAMLVSTLAPVDNERGTAAIDWFNRRGIHVIYRHVTEANNGCTLADFLTLNRLGAYVNLEVEHGDVDTHRAMVDRLIEFFASDVFAGIL